MVRALHADTYARRFPAPGWYYPQYVRARTLHYYPEAFQDNPIARVQLPWGTPPDEIPTQENFTYIQFRNVIHPPTLCGRAVGSNYYGRGHAWRAGVQPHCIACQRVLNRRLG